MEPQVVTEPSRLRRWILRVAANLLILLGAVLLGTSLVFATRSPESYPSDFPGNDLLGAAGPTVATTPSPIEHAHPGATPSAFVTQTPTPTPSPEPRPRRWIFPRPGEGFIEPLPDATQTGSPYRTNSAGQPATHISVPAVGVDADIVEVAPIAVQSGQQTVYEWTVADWAAGHHSTSANPGEGGNIVISGHDDVRGEVFRGLHDIEVGDEVILTTASATYRYVVQEIHMRRIASTSLDEQLSVGGFIAPMPEERLTLVTCWPYRVDTHRMIVVAKPVG